MNTERLNLVANAILKDLKATQSETLLDQVIAHLTNYISKPTLAQHQQGLAKARKSISEKLRVSASNKFPPTWNQVIEEFGYNDILGTKLEEKLDEIFSRNQITHQNALEEIQAIRTKIGNFSTSPNQITTGFEQLKIGDNKLEPGQCEIGVLVPRKFVKNNLEDFGKEIKELNRIFNAFSEIATGSRPGFKIREISSSALTIFLDSWPATGACVATALERLLAFYERLVDIKIKHAELKKLNLSDKDLEGIHNHANNIMQKGIEKIIPELMDKYYQDHAKGTDRKNELKVELKFCLQNLATRIDNGFNIEVRAEPPIKDEGDESDETNEEKQRLIENFKTISSAAKPLTFLKTGGEPILSLEESNDKEEKKKPSKK